MGQKNPVSKYPDFDCIDVKEGLVESYSDDFSAKSKRGDNSSLCSQSSFLDHDYV